MPPTLSPVAVPSLADASNHLSFSSREAESERASTRPDSRRLREQQDTIDDLRARLELEIRARAAADENAKIFYDLGFRHGMQIMEAQALARASALPHGFMPYTIPPPVQSLPVPFQGPQAGYGHTHSQTPSTSYNMPQSLRAASEASRQRPSVSTSSDSRSPLASSQYGGPAMLPSYTEHSQLLSSNGDEAKQHTSAGKTPDTPASPSAEVLPGDRVDSAEVRLSELRKKAMATTAAFRDRRAAQQWLNQNSHLVEGRTSAASAESTAGGKRKRTPVGEKEQYDSLLKRSPEKR